MICPFCQNPVDRFLPPGEGESGLRCPRCGEVGVPVLYPQEADAHPAVPVCILGPSGHGKTVYVDALLTHLERHARWPGYSCQWLDQLGMRESRQRLQAFREHGRLPAATRVIFQRPQVVRLRNVPRVGGCQLLLYDTGGEAFADTALIQDAGRYVRHSPAVVWLISLTELEYPEQLTDLLTVYHQAMTEMGADPKRQAVVVALTKGDLLVDHAGLSELPAAAREFLADDELDPAGGAWARLEAVSAALEGWLAASEYRHAVHLLRDLFRVTRFCIVSAQGGDAARGDALQLALAPRGVLAPLFWLWREALPVAWVEGEGGPAPYFSLAAAVAAAPPGGTVRLDPRTYTLPARVELRHPVRLAGAGADRTVVRSADGEFVLGVDLPAGEVTLDRLTVLHVGTRPADVVRVNAGRVALRGCAVRGGVAGEQPAVAGDGVRVAGTAEVTLTDCVAEENHGNGVSGVGRTRLALARCRAENNGGNGVNAGGEAAELADCLFRENRQSGVRLSGAVRGAVERCTCRKGGQSGILAGGQAAADLRGNTCEENRQHGIVAKDRAAVRARDNQCHRNGAAGIALVDRVTGEVAGNQCQGNGLYGVAVEGAAAPAVADNRCSRNERSGINYSGTAAGTCTGNTCDRNRTHGVRVSGTASPAVDGNTCTGNAGSGFHVAGGAAPRFGRGNVAANNAQGDYTPEEWGRRRWFR